MDPTWIVRLDSPGDGPRLAVKDCIDVEGLPTTVGCQLIAEQASPAARDASVVAAARRAGARIVGLRVADIAGFDFRAAVRPIPRSR
jgi:amidase